MDWLKKLGKDDRGSRPRCVLLTDGHVDRVAERLTRIVGRPEVMISSRDSWQPQGTSDVREAQLNKQLEGGAVLTRLIRETTRLSPDFERAGGVVQRLCGAGV